MSPFVSTRAFLQSIIATPVISLKSAIFISDKKLYDEIESENFNGKHTDDSTGQSIYKYVVYYHSQGEIAVGYTDWANHMNYNDNVSIDITTQEVSNWVKNNYGLGS